MYNNVSQCALLNFVDHRESLNRKIIYVNPNIYEANVIIKKKDRF